MIRLEWLGTDGSVWDLRDGPVRLAATGTKGLGIGALTTFTRQSAVQDGQVATGWRADPREVSLPLLKSYPGWSALAWADVDRAWWDACQPHKVGAFRVTDWDGNVRTLPARLTDDGYSMDFDPHDMGQDEFLATFVADQPWWLGPSIGASFGAASLGDFLAGGTAPPFVISSSNSSGTQNVVNPGDLDAWPVWNLQGPLASFTLNVGGSLVQSSSTLALLAGQSLTINTDPSTGQTALREDGTNVTRYLAAYGFAPIPAGGSRTVAVTTTGTGAVTMALQPRYFRAW